MNYIQQINEFWNKADESELKASDIAVYFALLRIANKYGWPKTFRADWPEVSMYAHISKNTFYSCISALEAQGFIGYEKGVKNSLKPRFFIPEFKNKTGIEQEQNGNKTGTEQEQNGNLNKQLNNERIKQLNNKTIQSHSLPFDSVVFLNCWEEWVKYRKEKRQKLTDTTIKKQLKALAEMGELKAIKSIEQSITNGWAGLFEPKESKPSSFAKNGKLQMPDWGQSLGAIDTTDDVAF